jgi:hypothetical protein
MASRTLPRLDLKVWMLGLILLAALATLLAPMPAKAAGPYITQTANVRACTNTGNGNCAPLTTIGTSTPVIMVCWRDESWATGAYSSNRWFLVRRSSDGMEGFVHSSLVGSQSTVPNCGSVPRAMAGLNAIARIGQVYANSSDAALFSDWAPGPYGEWSGDCKKLVSTAWYRATGRLLVSGNAKPTFDYYWANRGEKGYGYPRYGSLVGYNIAAPYGHIAVSVGVNRIVSTQGLDFARLPVAMQTTGSYSNPLGWVVP